MNRRRFITNATLASAGMTLQGCGEKSLANPKSKPTVGLKNNIHHSVCRWCFNAIPLEDLLLGLVSMGVGALDLVGPKDWPLLKKYNIDSSMCNGAELNLTDGWNNLSFHDVLIDRYTDMIHKVSDAGYTNLICFSGNRNGMDDLVGLKNCATGLKRIISLAESKHVVIQMELFNSKVDHPDYMCDSTAWGVQLCQEIGSPNFKLLYDIYHMQIQEGDIIRTITDFHQFFGHYHTAGVPGRHEIDETQELYYPAVMKAILDMGFQGYVAQEFLPTKVDQLAALEDAIRLCDV